MDLKVFSYLAYASTLVNNRNKLDARARKCVFLGYRPNIKGYVLFDLHLHSVFVSRNAVFYENAFPFYDQIYTAPLHIVKRNNTLTTACDQFLFDITTNSNHLHNPIANSDNNILDNPPNTIRLTPPISPMLKSQFAVLPDQATLLNTLLIFTTTYQIKLPITPIPYTHYQITLITLTFPLVIANTLYP